MLRMFKIWLWIQVLVALVLSAIMLTMSGVKAAESAAVGGMICVLGNWYFVFRVFRHSGARQAKQILKAFCWGELEKLVIYGGLFMIAVMTLPLSFLPMVLGFAANLMVSWLAAFVNLG